MMADSRLPEEWRPIEGWPDYEISNLGRVRRMTDAVSLMYGGLRKIVRTPADYILKPAVKGTSAKYKYHGVVLTRDSQSRSFKIAVLVCRAFCGEKPSSLHHAAHRDGNSFNDRADNLYWVTPKQNGADRSRHGRTPRSIDIGWNKLKEEDVLKIRALLSDGISAGMIARMYGVERNTIQNIKANKNWRWLK